MHRGGLFRALAPAVWVLGSGGGAVACAAGNDDARDSAAQLATQGDDGPSPTSAGTADDDGGDDDAPTGAPSGSDGAPSDDSGGMTTGCVEQSFFLDADQDGHGDPLAEVVACVAPAGHVPLGDDCDDADGTNAPSLTEFCDNKDNDCDGMVDEPPATTDCAACTTAVNGPSTYYFCADPLTFDEARAMCMGLGGDLLKVDDQAELDFLAAVGIPPSAGVGGWRNGLNDLATEGTFVWTDGSAPTVAPWNGGEPNDAGGNEDCVEMTVTADAWNDIPCAEPRAYVCEAG